MDQNKDIFGLNSKCSISLNEVIQLGNEKKKVARRRWAILAKALKSPTESQPSSPTDEFSVRRISSFMLLKTQELSAIPTISAENRYADQIKNRTWADYWKSQDRKYCDFCKCWIADNKPSVEFHEKGKRHQENVKKRLKTITKNSAKSQRETEKVDATLKQMEAAAMAAYRRDVESNANADLTSIAINKKMQEENLTISNETKKVWHEMKSKEGHVYYWNTLTDETIWEPPKEGYLSIKEQREDRDKETTKQLKELDKERRIEALQRIQIQKVEEEEERARLAREKLKERKVAEDLPEPVYGPIIDPGKNDPYGKWQTVKQSEPIDLQLPVQQEYFECPVVAEPEPVVKEFKEKTVESLENFGASSSFKKRKIGSWAKKNTRQRLNDD